VVFDQLDYASHQPVLNEVIEKLGGLDIIVINAGRSQRALAVETDLQVTLDILELNVLSYVSLTKLVVPYFQKQRRGSIVVTSSVAGKFGSTLSSSYSLTKWAINGYFNTVRTEVADSGINVTIVCPGPVATDIIKNAHSGSSGKQFTFDSVGKGDDDKMSPARHAILMARGIAARQNELWISTQPILTMVYASQYAPVIWDFVGNLFAKIRIRAYKRGVETLSVSAAWHLLRAPPTRPVTPVDTKKGL